MERRVQLSLRIDALPTSSIRTSLASSQERRAEVGLEVLDVARMERLGLTSAAFLAAEWTDHGQARAFTAGF